MTTTQQPANINKPIDFIPPSRRAANTATTFRNPCHVFGICLPKEQPKFSPVNVDKVKQPCDAKEKDGNEKSKDVSAQQEEIRVDTDDSGVPDLDLSYNDDTECCGSDGTATQKTVGRVLLEQPQEWMLKFFHLVISLIFLGRGGGGGNPHRITKTATGGKTSQPQETKCNVQEEEKKEDDKGSIHNPPSV